MSDKAFLDMFIGLSSIEEYHKKNLERGKFYHTEGMNATEKKKFLLDNVREIW